MNIISALMTVGGIRLTCSDKWLVYSGQEWVVYERKYKAKTSKILIKTQSQDEAIKILCEEA